MLERTRTPPPSVSQTEHDELTSVTPQNFADIPPILHWQGPAEVEMNVPSWSSWSKTSGTLFVTEQ